MSRNNQTKTNLNLNLNSIFDEKYIKKLNTKTQIYSIATILFFFSGIGLNSIDDYKNPNHIKKIFNYSKPIVIFLSMPFGILTAINGMKLISAKDFSIFDSKRNLRHLNQKPTQNDKELTKISIRPINHSLSPSIPNPVVNQPKSTLLSFPLKTHNTSP